MVNTLRSVIDAARIDAFLTASTEDRAAERNRSRHFLTISIDPSPALFLNNVSKISLPLEPISNQKGEREREKKGKITKLLEKTNNRNAIEHPRNK